MLRLSLSLAALLALALPALAGNPIVTFKPGPGGWSFSAEFEPNGVVNCRAILKAGGREDILAMRTNGDSYVSVKGEGRNGTFPDTILQPIREPETGLYWMTKAGANGARMWFTIEPNAIALMMSQGGYRYYLGGTEIQENVGLGPHAATAWQRVQACVARKGRP